MTKPRSLAWHLIMFGIVLSIPVVIFLAVSLWNLAEAEQKRIEFNAHQTAQELAGDIDNKVRALTQDLQIVAASAALNQGDFKTFQIEIDRVREETGLSLSLRQIGAQKQKLLSAGQPMSDRLPSPETIEALRKTAIELPRRPIVSGVQVPDGDGTDAREPYVTLRYPLWPQPGQTPTSRYELELAIPTRVVQQVLLENFTGKDVVAVIDGSKRIVARNTMHEDFVGKRATPDLVDNTTGTSGSWRGRTLDGRSVLGSYVRGIQSGWVVAVGVTLHELSLPFRQSIFLFAMIAIIMLTIAIALALLVGRRIIAAMRQLTLSAAAVDRGEIAAAINTPVTEVNQVGSELASSSARLVSQTRALAENEARMKAIYATDPVGILVAEAPSGRIIEGNQAIANIFRYPIIYSPSVDTYDQWIAFHGDGSRVEAHEYPIHRVIRGNEERPELECHALRGDGTKVWVRIIGAPLRDSTGKLSGALAAIVDIDDAKRAEDDQRLMNRELHHRVKNTLATVLAITNLTTRSTTDIAMFRKSFADRILSLSRTHTLLIENSWERIALRQLIEGELEPYVDDRRDRIEIEGEELSLPSDTALALGMAFHELTTNAVKYGALSRESGRLLISWHVIDGPLTGMPERTDKTAEPTPGSRILRFSWVESGGPLVQAPGSRGFGSQLLQQILARQLKGDVKMDFEPTGLEIHISMPY